jgi:hypothetical protein
MQYWDPNRRAFVDLLDGFTQLPFLNGLTFANPKSLLDGQVLSVLLHEYTHLVSLNGPISHFSAFHTAMSHAMHRLSELKAKHDPQGVSFMTLSNDHRFNPAEYKDRLAAGVFLEQNAQYLRYYVNFFNAYRWIFEGLALFVQWDYTPSLRFPPFSPLLKFVARFVDGTSSASSGDSQAAYELFRKAFEDVRIAESHNKHKWKLHTSNNSSDRDYYVGYLLIKRIWHILASREDRLWDPDLFFRFIIKFLLHDWGILTLCSSTGQNDIFEHERHIEERIIGFQCNALGKLVEMDAEYLFRVVNQLTSDSNSPRTNSLDCPDFLYSSSPEHEDILLVDVNDFNKEIQKRITQEIKKQFESLFSKRLKNSDYLRAECKDIISSTLDVFQIIRSHHSYFKLHASYCRFVGYQRVDPNIYALFMFPEGPYWKVNRLPAELAEPLLEHFCHCHANLITFPYMSIDLSCGETITQSALGLLLKHLGDEHSPPIMKTYDLYDDRAGDWIHVRVHGNHALTFAQRNQNEVAFHSDEFQAITNYLDRNSYWDRLMLRMAVFPDGYDYFGEYLMVESWDHSRESFLLSILHNAWKQVFANSDIDNNELDLFWARRIPILIARNQPQRELCEALCTQGNLIINSHDSNLIGIVDKINERWRQRVGTHLIYKHALDDRQISLLWLY